MIALFKEVRKDINNMKKRMKIMNNLEILGMNNIIVESKNIMDGINGDFRFS